jgi:hypothetical protein
MGSLFLLILISGNVPFLLINTVSVKSINAEYYMLTERNI